MSTKINKLVFIGHDFYEGHEGMRIKKYRKLFKINFKNSSFQPYFQTPRASPIGGGFMLDDILENIRKAEFCIFDLTGYNPKRFPHNLNVILELGMSIGVCKSSYVIWKKGKVKLDHISDLQQATPWRYEYKDNKELGKIIREILVNQGKNI